MPLPEETPASQVESIPGRADKSSLLPVGLFGFRKRAKKSEPSIISTGTPVVIFLLAIVFVCLFGNAIFSLTGSLHDLQRAQLSVEGMLLLCLAVWCGTFILLTFSWGDLPLIALLLIAVARYYVGRAASWRMEDAVILLAGVTVGKGTRFVLEAGGRRKRAGEQRNAQTANRDPATLNFLAGLIVLLTFSSWWQLEIPNYSYQGRRWAGLWDTPNIYGMLMAAGVVLAIGLLFRSSDQKLSRGLFPHFLRRKAAEENIDSVAGDSRKFSFRVTLVVAAIMMAVGLLFSYSRGACVGTMAGLWYLAKGYCKFEWRRLKPFLLCALCFLLLIVCLFWNMPRTAPWYLQRMDLSRGSVQHRITAWEASFKMMCGHPLGVGWNKTVQTYSNDYSPPENGVGAITTNDYLMLGTQLGFPALGCFVAYVALCLRRQNPAARNSKLEESGDGRDESRTLQTLCRAGGLVLAVSFWFDAGLFTLATASVFWILLELGRERSVSR